MSTLLKLAWTPLLWLTACHSGSSRIEPPFVDLPFEQALERAGEQDKLVMIDFFATWCPPCKQLDKTTWKDAGVIAWLGEKTVPLKVDVDQHRDLAARFRIQSIPTMVFVDSEGDELARVVGYRDPRVFVSEAESALDL